MDSATQLFLKSKKKKEKKGGQRKWQRNSIMDKVFLASLPKLSKQTMQLKMQLYQRPSFSFISPDKDLIFFFWLIPIVYLALMHIA